MLDPSSECAKLREIIHKQTLICEIGSGSGRHLIERAKVNPSALFLGVEIRYKRAVRTIEKSIDSAVQNTIVLRTDAETLPDILPPSTLSGVYINFPDPWPRRRSWKHRLLITRFFKKLYPLLAPDAFISIKTDSQDYFQAFLQDLQSESLAELYQINYKTHDLYSETNPETAIKSEFECLFIAQALPICHALLQRIQKPEIG